MITLSQMEQFDISSILNLWCWLRLGNSRKISCYDNNDDDIDDYDDNNDDDDDDDDDR